MLIIEDEGFKGINQNKVQYFEYTPESPTSESFISILLDSAVTPEVTVYGLGADAICHSLSQNGQNVIEQFLSSNNPKVEKLAQQRELLQVSPRAIESLRQTFDAIVSFVDGEAKVKALDNSHYAVDKDVANLLKISYKILVSLQNQVRRIENK